MQRLLEILLGLDGGFLGREGDLSFDFNPAWPGGSTVGHGLINAVLVVAAVALVVWIYRREGRKRSTKLILGGLRLSLLLLLITLLNRPVLTLTQTREEPSVVAVMVDDSSSMSVRDVGESTDPARPTRFAAANQLIEQLLPTLAETHQVELFRFDDSAVNTDTDQLATLEPTGGATQVTPSVRAVERELAGRNLAGVVVLSDFQDTPRAADTALLDQLRDAGVQILPVPVGSPTPPANLDVVSVSAQETAFAGDIVNIAVDLRADNLPAGEPVTLQLVDRATGVVQAGPDGRPARTTLNPEPGEPLETDLQIKTDQVGTLDLLVEAVPLVGELTEDDNRRPLRIEVLDASIAVLYVDGYPRWEFRYLKQELTRDKTVELSVLLYSADPGFPQGGNNPVRRFPESMDEMLEYDVILLGDVDPIQFSDFQLQLIREYVAEKGGGFGMLAGPRYSPQEYIGTPIEQVLPVDVTEVASFAFAQGTTITEGYRPVLTAAGEQLGMFRFFADREQNQRYLENDLPESLWYVRGIEAKPGVAQVLAQHPTAQAPSGQPAPLLIGGRYGSGRTLFAAIDDSWRWRYYTGEAVFNTYWVQNLRYLARGRKLGQRRYTFDADRPAYALGEQVTVSFRALDGGLLSQLGDSIGVNVKDSDGVAVRQLTLRQQENRPDTFVATFTADGIGTYAAELNDLPQAAGAGVSIQVEAPTLELARPQVDVEASTALASETGGEVVPLADALDRLPQLLTSAARSVPIRMEQALWDAPIALVLFVLLITAEWVGRKMAGML
ncbi:MAG: hypothetical protein AAGD32_05605 [Planctomycetota bacterium]